MRNQQIARRAPPFLSALLPPANTARCRALPTHPRRTHSTKQPGLELNLPRQRALLRAAAFGRPFCPPAFPQLALRDAARRLRALNAVRDAAVGMPLTMPQLEALTLPALISRWVVD